MNCVITSRNLILMILPIAIFSLLLTGCTKQDTPTYTGPPTKMTIGIYRGEGSAVMYVADRFGYLKQMGLDVELKEFASGAAALVLLKEGQLDVVDAADFVFASNIDSHPDLRILASINNPTNNYIVANKERGITKPADLKGKRIGVKRTSIADYYLGKFLFSNHLSLNDVTVVNMDANMMERPLVAGEIDAASVWDPVARQFVESLGINAVSWKSQGESRYHLVLIAQDSYIKKEPAAVVRLIRALVMAEKFIATYPLQVQRYLATRLSMPEKYINAVWGDNNFKVSLDRSLMLMLEEEYRWISTSRGDPYLRMPNYLNYLYFDALKTVRPESVTIIH